VAKRSWSAERCRADRERDRAQVAARKRRQGHARELIASLSPQIDALLAVAPATRVVCPWRLDRPGACPLRDRCPCGGRGWVTGWLAHRFRASLVAAVAHGGSRG
jgi:hypothetical protein